LPYKHAHNYLNLKQYKLPLPQTLNQYNKATTADCSKECKDVTLKPL